MPANIPLPDHNDTANLNGILCNFFNGNVLNKEDLRLYASQQLQTLQQQIQQLILTNENNLFWTKIKDLAALSGNIQNQKAIEQILALPNSINLFIKDNVSSAQSFEFYIKSKAAEIGSNDPIKDYYLAMKIRNDQILAYIYVFSQSVNNINTCLLFKPHEILTQPSFLYFGINDIENYIYETAQKLYEARIKLKLI